MNYQKIYDEIINNAKSRGLNKKLLNYYTEKHHIVPKCLGGTNDKSNLVLLTGREHYLCHHLLWKIHKNNVKLLSAFNIMTINTLTKSLNERYDAKITSKQYQILKCENAKIMSLKMKNKKRSHDSILKQIERQTGKPCSDKTKLLISEKTKGRIFSEIHKSRLSEKRKLRITKPETKLKIARIGADNGNSKMCIIDNIQFECVRAAYNYVNEKYGIYRRAFYKKLNDINEPNWFYK